MTSEPNVERSHKGAAAISVFLCSDSSCWCWEEDRRKRDSEYSSEGHDPDLDENGICRVCGQYEPE